MGNLFSSDIPDEVPDYIVNVKSGNKHGVGSTSSINIAFCNKDGKWSKNTKYTCTMWEDHFKPGNVKSFPIYNMPYLGELDKMELTQMTGGGWYVQWVEVVDCFTKETFMFPVHRWMKANKKVSKIILDTVC